MVNIYQSQLPEVIIRYKINSVLYVGLIDRYVDKLIIGPI